MPVEPCTLASALAADLSEPPPPERLERPVEAHAVESARAAELHGALRTREEVGEASRLEGKGERRWGQGWEGLVKARQHLASRRCDLASSRNLEGACECGRLRES